MSIIDTNNEKQIRPPMDVLISMYVPEDVTLSYSGYSSSAKIADGVLGEPPWNMRALADLQGNGFPLDNSRIAYDPTTAASQSNGKIGVRGNIGEQVAVTVTGSATVKALTITATGATAVQYNGTSYTFSESTAVVPVNARTVTLVFLPAYSTERIEVASIVPGVALNITNDSLVRAVVSLRSDLSPFGQSLPESQLTVEAFYDTDISEQLASIPDETPITYQAGYGSTMSQERKFYVTEPITWRDNLITIQAVDAVHLLDVQVGAPIEVRYAQEMFGLSQYFAEYCGFELEDYFYTEGNERRAIIPKGVTFRDVLAHMNNYLNISDSNGVLLGLTATLEEPMQFAYVDAGIPTVRTEAKTTGYTIYEEDCADVKREIARPYNSVTFEYTSPARGDSNPTGDYYAQQLGTATLEVNVGATLNFDKIAYEYVIGLDLGPKSDNDVATKLMNQYGAVYGYYHTMPVVPADKNGSWLFDIGNGYTDIETTSYYIGQKMNDNDVMETDFGSFNGGQKNSAIAYAQFIPWTQELDGWRYDNNASHKITTLQQMWEVLDRAGVIEGGSRVLDLAIIGCGVDLFTRKESRNRNVNGIAADDQTAMFYGGINATVKRSGTTPAHQLQIYPHPGYHAQLYRSNITGSFTWKGDPRMQPRDVVTFHRLNGTEEQITLENITITHEGGGTTAEITYRKGVI